MKITFYKEIIWASKENESDKKKRKEYSHH